jgi:hypothetical protein
MCLLNKFFILEYLNITRCLESILTLCPGALSSVLIPTFIIDHKNNKEHIINSETATISIVQQQQKILLVAINIKLTNYLKMIRCDIFITEIRNQIIGLIEYIKI